MRRKKYYPNISFLGIFTWIRLLSIKLGIFGFCLNVSVWDQWIIS